MYRAQKVHKLWPVRTFTTSVYRTWQLESLQLQLCITDDIVTSPPFGFCNVLINPANKVVWNGSRIFYVLSYAGRGWPSSCTRRIHFERGV
ncbi:unnamed protein product [Durusdinium trenchii]|uniref:Uncharacterized protein n=1 Tax=Durusdinium trenchii TaxID=1381693 RepID=A0ABP0N244_9DINO